MKGLVTFLIKATSILVVCTGTLTFYQVKKLKLKFDRFFYDTQINFENEIESNKNKRQK